MLHFERKSATAGLAKNVTKSNLVLPRVCVTKIFIGFGDQAARDKIHRFWQVDYDSAFLGAPNGREGLIDIKRKC